jgi:hypothetical protein
MMSVLDLALLTVGGVGAFLCAGHAVTNESVERVMGNRLTWALWAVAFLAMALRAFS